MLGGSEDEGAESIQQTADGYPSLGISAIGRKLPVTERLKYTQSDRWDIFIYSSLFPYW